MIPLLKAEQIEVKVKKITEKGAIALLYKTARTDMEVLDEVFGQFKWRCRYEEIKGNLYCTIDVWDSELNQWVSKQDCGIESREDDEGNQKKGEASDAFKRAGFKWGIGRELYSAPFVFLPVETEKQGQTWKLKKPFQSFEVVSIGYDSDRRINQLEISDGKKVLYRFPSSGKVEQAKQPEKQPEPQKAEPDPEAVITKDQYKYLLSLIMTKDNQIDPTEQKFLETTYKEYGYQKANQIQQKNFQAIVDKVSGKLPFDL